MNEEFEIPQGMHGRFAVVKLWPDIKTAEDECIARLKLAAQALGLACVEVHADGTLLNDSASRVSFRDVDFVLHLHYDTPKLYDAFSLVALWNPVRFYHEWGYERTSRNLTTHDDFISCLSPAADDHVARMVRNSGTHFPAQFRLFHSTADAVHAPTLGDQKLFYAGINWEALGGGKSRHQEVLKRLDGTGLLRIYGPTIFQGVRVWAGYASYVREVPFDGISMIDEIARAGIALVLSSQAHKDSELMSNRLFESIAAGALVICDENPFAARHFGDSLLYIDGRSTADQIEQDVRRHLDWVRAHPELALAKARRAQEIFRSRFTLIQNLRDLYQGLPQRKLALAALQDPRPDESLRVQVDFLMPEYSGAVLQRHLRSAAAQTVAEAKLRLVVDERLSESQHQELVRSIAQRGVALEVVKLPFVTLSPATGMQTRHRLGEVVLDLLGSAADADAVVFVAANEELWSGHVATLAAALKRDPRSACAATAVVLAQGSEPVHAVHDLIDFRSAEAHRRSGLGRFIFRTAAIPQDIAIVLRHLDALVAPALIGQGRLLQLLAASMRIELDNAPVLKPEALTQELAAVDDFAPQALVPRGGYGPRPLPGGIEPASLRPLTALQLARKLFNLRWLHLQYRALRHHGARARWSALRRRLGLA